MIPGRTTQWRRWRDAIGLVTAVGLACCAAVAGDAPPVREKIQFSGPGDAIALPSSRPKDDLLSKPFEFLDRDNSVSGVVAPALAPAALPSYQRNSRLQELFEQRLDQKRNWIFGQPEDFGRTPTAEDVFNIGAFGDAETKPKTALEKFLSGSGSKPGRRHLDQVGSDRDKHSLDKPISRFERDDRPREEISSPLSTPYDSSRFLSAGFSFPNDFLGKSSGPGSFNDFLNAEPADPGARMRDDRKRTDEFKKLPNFSGPVNPLTPALDPIQWGVDTTRQELNPVTAPRLGELPGIGRGALNLNPLHAISGPPSGRFNGLDDQTAKILGPSSLAPVVSAPADSPLRQPTPTVLEFPKRRF